MQITRITLGAKSDHALNGIWIDMYYEIYPFCVHVCIGGFISMHAVFHKDRYACTFVLTDVNYLYYWSPINSVTLGIVCSSK